MNSKVLLTFFISALHFELITTVQTRKLPKWTKLVPQSPEYPVTTSPGQQHDLRK